MFNKITFHRDVSAEWETGIYIGLIQAIPNGFEKAAKSCHFKEILLNNRKKPER